jgi:hypothetical protein
VRGPEDEPASPPSRAASVIAPLVTFARVAARDLAGVARSDAPAREHLLAAERWLCRAQDVCAEGGVSYGYSIKGGWRAPYPETSGYIAPTFFRLARLRDPSYRERALRIVRWLLSIQNVDGSFANPRYGKDGIVFDTGQVLFGLVCGHEATGDGAMLAAACRAADWLTRIADGERLWTRHEHLDTAHVYNTRTAWALLRMNEVEFAAAREDVARANCDWALACQQPSGLFARCAFREGAAPFTHTIAYAARGLIESGLLLGDDGYVDAARRCADAAALHLRDDGFLPSMLSIDGRARSATCCLTGNCQFALVWSRLADAGFGTHYRALAKRALGFVMASQDLATSNDDVRGAIKGSQPVWGPYATLSYPNWATKFFIDAMWLTRDADA